MYFGVPNYMMAPSASRFVPIVVEQTGSVERSFDIFSRLLKERVVILNSEVDDNVAGLIVAQLLHLEAENQSADITLYINSPGGSVSAGMAIYDTMQYIKPDVRTICLGHAASMGAFLLAAGAKGKRYALPNAEIMIHQPSSGTRGQVTDMEIATKHVVRLKDRLNKILAENTGQPLKKIKADVERDYWMEAEEAKLYGLIDDVLQKR